MSTDESSAEAVLREKLRFLRKEEAMTADLERKFELRKRIEEVREKLGEARGSSSVPGQARPRRQDELARWIFTGLLLLFLLGVVLVGPERLPAYKQPVLTLIAGTFAGFLGFFLSGRITVRIGTRSPLGRLALEAAGGTALFVLVLWWWPQAVAETLYRVQVTVLDPSGQPEESALVSSDTGGVATGGAGGRFVIEIPAARVPDDSQVTVRADQPAAFLAASDTVDLDDDFDPSLTLRLLPITGARISGKVYDGEGRTVEGARVSVARHSGHALTDADGYFELDAHAAEGQMVSLHAEKDGVGIANQSHPAGPHPARLTLQEGR